jgi:hypothetical protein
VVHFGTGVDVTEIHYEKIPKYAFREILEQYPCHDFKNAFVDLVVKQTKIKPNSHIATQLNLGFGTKVKKTLFIA